MLPTYVWFSILFAAAATTLVLLPFARGRALLIRWLPAWVFFGLLLGTLEAGFQVGLRSQKKDGESVTIYTCSMHLNVRVTEPGLCPSCRMELVPLGSASSMGSSADEIVIDPVVVQNMGVRTQRVERSALHTTVRAFGELRVAEDRRFDVALKFDAFVESLRANVPGMRVQRGDVLFAVYSPELVIAQAELIAARRSGDAQLLLAARQKLLLWDLDASTVDELQARDEPLRTLQWKSPRDGALLQKDLVDGAPAAKSTALLRFADLSTLWLDARVPASRLSLVQLGAEAEVVFAAEGDSSLRGKVVFVAPELDPATRTAVVRVAVPNADFALRPGAFARVAIAVPVAESGIAVPQEAVLDTGLRKLVWLAVGKGRFAPRPVETGAVLDDGRIHVRGGLADGDVVVLSGQFLIDSESRLREGARKLDDEGLMQKGEVPAPTAIPLSPKSQAAIDALLAAYLHASEEFAADRFDPAHWKAVHDATDALLTGLTEIPAQVPATELAALLDKQALDIEAARVQWKKVSAQALRLFEIARPRGTAGNAQLFVHHCPMAEADWLQPDDTTRNPYYGSSMLDCGAVRRSLPLLDGGGK